MNEVVVVRRIGPSAPRGAASNSLVFYPLWEPPDTGHRLA
jgi:hypothetical protein